MEGGDVEGGILCSRQIYATCKISSSRVIILPQMPCGSPRGSIMNCRSTDDR